MLPTGSRLLRFPATTPPCSKNPSCPTSTEGHPECVAKSGMTAKVSAHRALKQTVEALARATCRRSPGLQSTVSSFPVIAFKAHLLFAQ
jgi:hypothetical protein